MFTLRPYTPPDFETDALKAAPLCRFEPAPLDGVAPAGYHAMSIFPEYFKTEHGWLLAEESRMDCVAVLSGGKIREMGAAAEVLPHLIGTESAVASCGKLEGQEVAG